MKQPFLSLFIHHALVLTIIFGTIYTIVQQNYRMSANDPQIQMAEDAANDLSNGVSPQTISGKPPVLPDGVLDFTRANGEDRVTWQPRNDVRIAAILKHYSGSKPGFVLVGRSLREVEEREYSLMMLVGTGWILSLVTDVFCVWVRRRTM
jgi:hypothetical protein